MAAGPSVDENLEASTLRFYATVRYSYNRAGESALRPWLRTQAPFRAIAPAAGFPSCKSANVIFTTPNDDHKVQWQIASYRFAIPKKVEQGPVHRQTISA